MEKRRGASRTGEADLIEAGTIDGACVFVSDLHLMDPRDSNTASFLELCAELSRPSAGSPLGDIRHLFLLGDVFEFIDASTSFFRKLWSPVFRALEQLRNKGVHVYFLEGNHDFGFEYVQRLEKGEGKASLWEGPWATFAGDAGLEFRHESLGLLHVRHGDDVVASEAYLRFRDFVKSPFAGRLLRQIPARLSHHFFLWLAEQSRKRGEGYVLTEDKIFDDVRLFVGGGSFSCPDALVIGHIHVHLDAKVGPSRVLAGPDWPSAASYLLLEAEGSFTRHFLRGAVAPPLMRFSRRLSEDS